MQEQYEHFIVFTVLFFVAIELCRNGSTLFLFSDADAKDRNRSQEVVDAAITKRIVITSLITGTCPRGRRSIQCKLVKETYLVIVYESYL